jgi:hypothetical protein
MRSRHSQRKGGPDERVQRHQHRPQRHVHGVVQHASGPAAARSCLAMALVLLTGGCPRDDRPGGSDGAGSSRQATATAPTASAAPPADASGWVGTWASSPCGERPYVRVVELRPKGVAAVHDRVSPCPPKVACVWSGIISYEGTWELKQGRVQLKLERKTYPNMKAAPLPTELSWSGSPVGVEAGVRCSYGAE